MPMDYAYVAITDALVPRARVPLVQTAIDTYASETNKVISVWRCFGDGDLASRPHARARTVLEILKHQLLSERRFFGEFLGVPEPPPAEVLPKEERVVAYTERMHGLALPRLEFLAAQPETWWVQEVPFFDVVRSRQWVFWRRVLHTAHHRTQLTVYLRLMDRAVPVSYGPTGDITWAGADPTQSIDAAERKTA